MRGGGASFESIWEKLARELYYSTPPMGGGGADTTPLLLATANELMKAMQEGGVSYQSLPKLVTGMTDNIFIFSGFKTYQELQQASLLLRDAQGKLRSFADFRKEIKNLNATYNSAYLQAEYNHAVASSQMAVKWQEFDSQKDKYDLVYDAVGDLRTRPEHAALDGVVEPVDSTFWDTHYPPNGWNCRCTVYQVDKGTKGTKLPKDIPANPILFQNNVGKTGIIFPSSHPYFQNLTEVQRKVVNGSIEKAREVLFRQELAKVEQHLSTVTGLNEEAMIVDKYGNRLLPNYLKSYDKPISFSEEAQLLAKNNVVTHNHPDDTFFSTYDIRFVIANNPAEFRAVWVQSKKVLVVRRPENGWDVEDKLDDIIYFYATEGGDNINADNIEDYLNFHIGKDIAKALGWHITTEEL